MLIYDWEIFKHNSLLGILDVETDTVTQLWNIDDIKQYIMTHLEDIWIRIQF